MLAALKAKRARFDEKDALPVFGFVPIDKSIFTASYEIVYLIARQSKPLTIGEELIKPATLKITNIMLGKAAETRLSPTPCSNCRVDAMDDNIFAQLLFLCV